MVIKFVVKTFNQACPYNKWLMIDDQWLTDASPKILATSLVLLIHNKALVNEGLDQSPIIWEHSW